MARKDVLGRSGEQLAADHLLGLGYEVIDRNWRCPIGEIDLVARHGSTTVVVEVKTRSGRGYGHPLDAITPVKLARLRRLAGAWVAAHGPVERLRIDAIAVVADRDGVAVEHVRQVC
ncbi:YraN family protein [Microcella flavibacter]|uniref:YraN family protein n=1 Tax=Microcella flavibacter TaxID=1804990 RepID=UPI0014567217|nr:YraN family protein [Microcella flavibacter]